MSTLVVSGNPKVMPRTVVGGGLPKIAPAPRPIVPLAPSTLPPAPNAIDAPRPVTAPVVMPVTYAPDVLTFAPDHGQPAPSIVPPARDMTTPTTLAVAQAAAQARRDAALVAARDGAALGPQVTAATPDLLDLPIIVRAPTEVLTRAPDGSLAVLSASPAVQAAALREAGQLVGGPSLTPEARALTAPSPAQQAAAAPLGTDSTSPAATAMQTAGVAGSFAWLAVLGVAALLYVNRRKGR